MKLLNILILDDEQMLLDLLTMMLQPHTSTMCSSLGEAQTLISSDQEAFDVMLCDIMMPRGGGLDLHEWLSSTYPNLVERLLFVTGGVGHDLRQKINAVGRPILYKPFSIAQLHESLAEFL